MLRRHSFRATTAVDCSAPSAYFDDGLFTPIGRARRLAEITRDLGARTVTFYGQTVNSPHRPGTITMSWDELWIG